MKNTLQRIIFVGLSTTITVFFSEKAYWYVQGYELFGLVLYYALPVYLCFWAVDHFRVRRLSAVVLIAALYGFLIEGVLTTVIYEDGPFSPVMPGYFVGWHGLLSVVFGWYAIRKWLTKGMWRRILGSSLLFGLFWGIWSLTFWLPETFEAWENPGQWPSMEYGLYTFAFTVILALSHWLLGQGAWLREFKPNRVERWAVSLAFLALFGLTTYPLLPVAIFKLGVLLAIVYLGLRAGRGGPVSVGNESVFSMLAGPVSWVHILPLLAMPLVATAVYILAAIMNPAESQIRNLYEGIPVLQVFTGVAAFVWAMSNELRWQRRSRTVSQA